MRGGALLLLRSCVRPRGLFRPGYAYVKNGSDGSHVLQGSRCLAHLRRERAHQVAKPRHEGEGCLADGLTVAFDASSKPSLKHFNELATKQPFGIAEVASSLRKTRRVFADGDAQLLRARRRPHPDRRGARALRGRVHPRRGFHGLRLTFEFMLPTDKQAITVDQVSIVDAGTKEVHFLAVSCSSSCYERKKDTINSIVDSWTVKER
jgi:hypothetical protein